MIPSLFECGVCRGPFTIEGVQLDCGHRYCNTCISTLVNEFMQADISRPMICALGNCTRALSNEEIRAFLSESEFQRYVDVREGRIRASPGHRIVNCVRPGCISWEVPEGQPYVECPTCSKSFCPLCKRDPHARVPCSEAEEYHRLNTLSAEAQNRASMLFIEELEQQDNAERIRRVDCPVCMEQVELESCVTLDCEHPMCTDCFSNYLTGKIEGGEVGDEQLVCPIQDCRTAITALQVEAAVGREIYERFLRYRIDQWQPEDDSRRVQCPSPNCAFFLVRPGQEEAQCPECQSAFCPSCVEASHVGQTCDAAREARAARRAEADAEIAVASLAARSGWQQCPVCKVRTERSRGCNNMTCTSPQCKGKTKYCYICGQVPQGNHFPQGIYADSCVNVSEEEYRARREGS